MEHRHQTVHQVLGVDPVRHVRVPRLAVQDQLDRVEFACGGCQVRRLFHIAAVVVGAGPVAVVEEEALLCRVGVLRPPLSVCISRPFSLGAHVVSAADRHEECAHWV